MHSLPQDHASNLPEPGSRTAISEPILTAKPVELLADIPRSRGEILKITRESHRGRETVHIRVWFRAEDGEMRPSKSGVSIQPDNLDEVIAALSSAQLKITGRGAF